MGRSTKKELKDFLQGGLLKSVGPVPQLEGPQLKYTTIYWGDLGRKSRKKKSVGPSIASSPQLARLELSQGFTWSLWPIFSCPMSIPCFEFFPHSSDFCPTASYLTTFFPPSAWAWWGVEGQFSVIPEAPAPGPPPSALHSEPRDLSWSVLWVLDQNPGSNLLERSIRNFGPRDEDEIRLSIIQMLRMILWWFRESCWLWLENIPFLASSWAAHHTESSSSLNFLLALKFWCLFPCYHHSGCHFQPCQCILITSSHTGSAHCHGIMTMLMWLYLEKMSSERLLSMNAFYERNYRCVQLKVIDGVGGSENLHSRTQVSFEQTGTKGPNPSSQDLIVNTWLIVLAWCLIRRKSAQG